MIPRVIHQIWIGDQSKRPQKLMDTWKEKNPTWEYRLWDDDCLFMLKNQAQFDAIKKYSGKADILRYEILYNNGGFFIDADSACINPLDDFFLDNDSFCCWENEYVRTGLMANGYLGASKNNELMRLLVEGISRMDPVQLSNLPPNTTWQAVGPGYLTSTVQMNAYNKLRIYPSHYFIPKHFTNLEYTGNEKVYGHQYYLSTPINLDQRGSYEDYSKTKYS